MKGLRNVLEASFLPLEMSGEDEAAATKRSSSGSGVSSSAVSDSL